MPDGQAVDEPGEVLLGQHALHRVLDGGHDQLLDRGRAGRLGGRRGSGLIPSPEEPLEQLGQDLLPLGEVLVEGGPPRETPACWAMSSTRTPR